MSDSESDYEEEPAVPTASTDTKPVQEVKPTVSTVVKPKNERKAGRKPGKSVMPQKNSEYQQSKLMAETFKEYSEMLISTKKEIEELKKTLNDTINSEETKHKKEIKNAVQEARMAFARTLNR